MNNIISLVYNSIDELLDDLVSDIDSKVHVQKCINRFKLSSAIHSDVSFNFLSTLLLLEGGATCYLDPSDDEMLCDDVAPINDYGNNVYKLDTESSLEPDESPDLSGELIDAIRSSVERDNIAYSYLASKDMSVISRTAWSLPLLREEDVFNNIFDTDNPLVTLDKYLSEYFFTYEVRPERKISYYLSDLIEFVLDNVEFEGKTTFICIYNSYKGESELSLDIGIINELLHGNENLYKNAELDTSLQPIATILIDIITEHIDDRYFISEYYESILNLYPDLLLRLSKTSSSVGLSNIVEYVKAESSGFSVSLIPDFSTVLEYYGTEGFEGPLASNLVNALSMHVATSLAPKFLIPLHQAEFFDIVENSELNLLLKVFDSSTEYEPFLYGCLWEDVELLINKLRENKRYDILDAFISSYLFLRVIVYKLPIKEAAFIANVINTDLIRNNNSIKKIINVFSSKEFKEKYFILLGRFVGMLDLSDSNTSPNTNITDLLFTPYTEADYVGRLKDILTNEVWSLLSESSKNDLIQSEISFEAYRDRLNKNSLLVHERSFFVHIGCFLESELKSVLKGVISSLEVYFNKTDTVSNSNLLRIKGIVQKNQSLGSLVNMVSFSNNIKILKTIPECKTAIEASNFINNILSNTLYKDALMNISANYRNPASHDSDKKLFMKDVMALRSILYKEGLLKAVIQSRCE